MDRKTKGIGATVGRGELSGTGWPTHSKGVPFGCSNQLKGEGRADSRRAIHFQVKKEDLKKSQVGARDALFSRR